MEYLGEDSHNASLYTADITYTSSGLQGLSLRVLPKHANLSSPYEAGVILWAH
jgi:starch phosphorylase